MFAVPEVDDDIEVSNPVETTEPIMQLEPKRESPSSTTPPTVSAEKVDKNPIKIQIPSSTTATSKQHRSRRGLFHRNTIHICDQILDRM
ncbi:unnamed protein product [Rotaria magnacalcarata]|uniref:Uncharacterized protein n=1 Tax=Rotaria magnacalcarata TaxID=392030 RepID=A0A815ZT42_9BILA|nr:unnamed protein product [Rotaria magnacalcarata]CAF3795071.1 unnamed protein product [Rotaria magnacalcarata]CAF3821157.1 unnamed protein product [Rotaria magnacalcarata]CAF3915696.1 unnamed protein product [Rotaria magnacalcarata]